MTREETKREWPKGTRVDVMAGGSAPMYQGTVIGYGQTPGDIRIKRDCHKTPETWPADLCRKVKA